MYLGWLEEIKFLEWVSLPKHYIIISKRVISIISSKYDSDWQRYGDEIKVKYKETQSVMALFTHKKISDPNTLGQP